MNIGDTVRINPKHYLSEIFKGTCIIDDLKVFQFRPNKPNRYHIKTINKNKEGSHLMTWVDENEIISISDIRNQKLKQLGL